MTTTPEPLGPLKQSVASALQGIERAFPGVQVEHFPDGQGGAWVRIVGVGLSGTYVQDRTDVIFLLPFNLPGVDIYPIFVRADLARSDAGPLGQAFQVSTLAWTGSPSQMPVVQISRRTQGDFAAQTAAQKVEKVLAWMREV